MDGGSSSPSRSWNEDFDPLMHRSLSRSDELSSEEGAMVEVTERDIAVDICLDDDIANGPEAEDGQMALLAKKRRRRKMDTFDRLVLEEGESNGSRKQAVSPESLEIDGFEVISSVESSAESGEDFGIGDVEERPSAFPDFVKAQSQKAKRKKRQRRIRLTGLKLREQEEDVWSVPFFVNVWFAALMWTWLGEFCRLIYFFNMRNRGLDWATFAYLFLWIPGGLLLFPRIRRFISDFLPLFLFFSSFFIVVRMISHPGVRLALMGCAVAMSTVTYFSMMWTYQRFVLSLSRANSKGHRDSAGIAMGYGLVLVNILRLSNASINPLYFDIPFDVFAFIFSLLLVVILVLHQIILKRSKLKKLEAMEFADDGKHKPIVEREMTGGEEIILDQDGSDGGGEDFETSERTPLVPVTMDERRGAVIDGGASDSEAEDDAWLVLASPTAADIPYRGDSDEDEFTSIMSTVSSIGHTPQRDLHDIVSDPEAHGFDDRSGSAVGGGAHAENSHAPSRAAAAAAAARKLRKRRHRTSRLRSFIFFLFDTSPRAETSLLVIVARLLFLSTSVDEDDVRSRRLCLKIGAHFVDFFLPSLSFGSALFVLQWLFSSPSVVCEWAEFPTLHLGPILIGIMIVGFSFSFSPFVRKNPVWFFVVGCTGITLVCATDGGVAFFGACCLLLYVSSFWVKVVRRVSHAPASFTVISGISIFFLLTCVSVAVKAYAYVPGGVLFRWHGTSMLLLTCTLLIGIGGYTCSDVSSLRRIRSWKLSVPRRQIFVMAVILFLLLAAAVVFRLFFFPATRGELKGHPTFNIMSVNVQQGFANDGSVNFPKIVKLVVDHEVDVLCLQESETVDYIMGNNDLIEYLSARLEIQTHYTTHLRGYFGVTIISTVEPGTEDPLTIELPADSVSKANGIVARTNIEFLLRSIHVFNVFLGRNSEEEQVVGLKKELEAVASNDIMLMAGDLNLLPGSDSYHSLVDLDHMRDACYLANNKTYIPTAYFDKEPQVVDYLLFRENPDLHLQSCTVLRDWDVTNHAPVLAKFTFGT